MTDRAPIPTFERRDGQLVIGGVPVKRLAERVGSTPFFAYDREKLTERMEQLRSALPPEIHLSYAVKANPMPAVVHHLRALLDGFDVASSREMHVALDAGMPSDRISFAGPGKTDHELRQAVAAGVTVEVESPSELNRLIETGNELALTPRVAVRVNPDFSVKGSGMRMGGGPQQFGVDSERVPELLDRLSGDDVEFLGFHVFAGSQNLRADVISEAQSRTVELVTKLAASSPLPLRYLNLGGGFGIPYFEKDQPLDLKAVGTGLRRLLDRAVLPELPDTRLTVELGRYIVGEAGVYVSRVLDRKESRGKTFLVLDGGLHHQLAASGNFGQVIRRNYPMCVATRMDETPDGIVDVVGCLCTPLDLLGRDVDLPRAEVGDLVAIFQAGAYGLTASPTSFLSHPPPIEVLV